MEENIHTVKSQQPPTFLLNGNTRFWSLWAFSAWIVTQQLLWQRELTWNVVIMLARILTPYRKKDCSTKTKLIVCMLKFIGEVAGKCLTWCPRSAHFWRRRVCSTKKTHMMYGFLFWDFLQTRWPNQMLSTLKCRVKSKRLETWVALLSMHCGPLSWGTGDWHTYQTWKDWHRVWEKLNLNSSVKMHVMAGVQIYHKPVSSHWHWHCIRLQGAFSLQSDAMQSRAKDSNFVWLVITSSCTVSESPLSVYLSVWGGLFTDETNQNKAKDPPDRQVPYWLRETRCWTMSPTTEHELILSSHSHCTDFGRVLHCSEWNTVCSALNCLFLFSCQNISLHFNL